jgi:class 3 adenylate cyclase/tetratricopeptide (TPR) repeat protein
VAMRVCPSCTEENEERARFCWSCGGSLEAKAPTATEERKVVSVLFCDLVGFTARSDSADPEDVRATLRAYHERLKREIERFGGTVEKFVGDAVMAVFGAPVAHEDDAERAVRAALRIAQAIDELNEERPGLDLAIRGAVNTGEAVVTLGARPEAGEGFVTGDVVNVASRLQSVAPVGGVVVGELTYRSTSDQILYEELDPIEVKGKERPLSLWRAVEARSRFGVDVEQRTHVPLIGRDHDLNLLKELFGRVVREQTVQLVTIVGEPGVGKSRLVWEFQRFVDDLPDIVRWRQGRCLPYGEGITFWALAEVVKSQAGILENDSPEEAASKLDLAVASIVDEGERDWIGARLKPLVGLGEEAAAAEREESFTAWRGFLEAIASQNPFVLVVEDVHWADPAMLAFVRDLADWSSGVPMLVVCTARPELYEREPNWGGGTRNHTAISLSPLSPEETAQLIGALLDRAVLPAETQSALLTRAGGNPLYAEEFIRMLIDRGVLVRRGASWNLTADEADISVPENVHALIAARLDTLSPERKALLQDASVIGKVFWTGALVDMANRDARAVREGLHELARKELVRPARRPSIEGETEFAFWHLLIRDVAYGQIPRAARAEKHRAAAAWIEKIAGERVADSAELLAHHYEQALDLARAAGEVAPEIETQARRFLMLAAERALRLDAGKAGPYFERALALTRPDDPDRLPVLMFAGKLGLMSVMADRADELLLDAVELARAVGNPDAEAEALAWLSRLAWPRGETARQLELLEQATKIIEGRGPSREAAIVRARRVAAQGLAGAGVATLAEAEVALPVIREFGSDVDLLVVLQFRGQARLEAGDVDGGFADLREGLRIALEAAPAQLLAAAHVNLGDCVWFQEGPAEGQVLYEAGAELGERRGASASADWAHMETMWTCYDLGAWDDLLETGQRLLDRDLERGRSLATSQLSVLAEIYRRDVIVHRGLPDPGDLVERSLVQRAREIGDGQVLVPGFRVAALGRLSRGDVEGALALASESEALLRERPWSMSWSLDWSSRVCRAAGDADLLRSLVARGIEHLTRNANSVASARAVLAELEGEHEHALERYDDAAARWKAFPSVLEQGLALQGSGRCLLQLRRPNEAAPYLRSARSAYASLGAAPLVAEVDALLAEATAKTS